MIDADTLIDSRYRVISRIGSGGMADVYLSEDRLLGRQVAVKILHPRFAEDQEFVERFRREAQSAAGLSHPNVVAIFDRGEWNGTYYIAMEYLSGRSLKRIVREHGALEPQTAIDITIQILHAARFAHRRGIIHRDLKPHNVILDEEGRAKVTDFGIARAGASDMTLTGSIMGTAQYLSPEQAQGQPVSASSDLYAIGIVLYELLTGHIPFDGETAVSIALKQVSAVPPAPSAINPAVPPALDAAVLRALAKDPAQRYRDADEFIAALEEVRGGLSGQHLTAVSPGAPANNHPASGGLLLPPAEPLDRKNAPLWWILAAVVAILAAAAAAYLLLGPASRVTVPNVAGLARAQANARLQRSGLKPSDSTATSPTAPLGTVINSSPGAGRTVPRDSRVTLVISSGPGSAPLPEVDGLERDRAVQILRKQGFVATVHSQPSPTVKQGRVISTDPPAGSDAQIGSPVDVVVSSGPAQSTVPEVIGDTEGQAKTALSEAGLKLGAVTSQTSTQTPGTVISQSTEGGQKLPAGGSVDIVLAQAAQTVPVPEVLEEKEERAVGELHGAGFKAKIVKRNVSEPSQNGVVLTQNPRAGIKAKRGSAVTITVGVAQSPTETTTTTTTTTTTPTTSTPVVTPPPAPAGGQ